MIAYGGKLRAVLDAPLIVLAAQVVLLAALAATVGLGGAGWITGLTCGALLTAALARGMAAYSEPQLTPATWVTLTRATLAVGVAGLTADSLVGSTSPAPLVALATVALALDWVDGQLARRTATESRLGAKMDGEVDAFLMLVLSVAVAPTAGYWVLAIGAARYAFLAAGWAFVWMRAPLPRRDWRKTVTAVQGVVLVVAAADVLPLGFTQLALAGALILLAESFGRDVWWLWRRRSASAEPVASAAPAPRPRWRSSLAVALTVVAVLIVWAVLVAPSEPILLKPDVFIRLPLEGLVVVLVILALPRRVGRILACVVGAVLGVLLVVKMLDFGFITAFDRPFNPIQDWSYLSIGRETLVDTYGSTRADLIVVGIGLAVVAALVIPALALLRVTDVAARNRRTSTLTVAALGLAWVVLQVSGTQMVTGVPIASASAVGLAVHEVDAVQSALDDPARFAAMIRHDPYASPPPKGLLTTLRGHDVLLVFVESYGKFAVQGSSISPPVDAVLHRGNQQLTAAGFSARSGWMQSPTFGGISWLAHSTMQSGLWVNSNDRYDQLLSSHRYTLSEAFKGAGYRVVDDVPADDRPWGTGLSFYHWDKIYNRLDVGYHGPTYAYAPLPDQYLYAALQRQELSKPHRRPLFAEIDTVSSHWPWTKIPPLIPWSEVGNGSVYNHLPVDRIGEQSAVEGYGHSIDYSLRALFSFVTHYGDKNLVMVVLGDHQPAHQVSGLGVDHNVPISIIAHDPKVLRRAANWGWVAGMRPTSAAPVWRMSAFRNRFLRTFSSPRPSPGQ